MEIEVSLKTLVITSGYFNPLGAHHIEYLKGAAFYGDKLVVIVNNDTQVGLKGSIPFQTCEERIKIVSSLDRVNIAWRSQDTDLTVCETIKAVWRLNHDKYEIIFANGGDVRECREKTLCDALGIKTVYNVGGAKSGSSSNLIEKAAMAWLRRMPEGITIKVTHEEEN